MNYDLSDASKNSDMYQNIRMNDSRGLCDLPRELLERVVHYLWEPPQSYSGLYYERPESKFNSLAVLYNIAATCKSMRSMLGPRIWYGVSIAAEAKTSRLGKDNTSELAQISSIIGSHSDR